jgi:hypothetical protein
MNTSFLNEVKTAIRVALFKHQDMHHVASDKHKTPYAFYIIIGAAVLSLIGQQLFAGFFKPTLWMGIGMAVIQVVMTIVSIYIISVIAKSIFKGQAKHDEFFRVLAYAMIVSWLIIFPIPMLGLISAIWSLILLFVVLKVIHKLTTSSAIGTIIIGFIIVSVIFVILSPVFSKFGFGYSIKDSFNFGKVGGNSFEMNIPTEEGTGNVKVEGGKMTITGPDGETVEVTIPQY